MTRLLDSGERYRRDRWLFVQCFKMVARYETIWHVEKWLCMQWEKNVVFVSVPFSNLQETRETWSGFWMYSNYSSTYAQWSALQELDGTKFSDRRFRCFRVGKFAIFAEVRGKR